jgi:hypothetical protein
VDNTRRLLDPDELAERAARNAKRAAVFTGFCVLIAAVILALDHSIKRAILDETGNARRIVDEFRKLTEATADGGAQTGEARAIPSAADGADSGVGDDSGPRAETPANAADGKRAPGRGKTGVRPGP